MTYRVAADLLEQMFPIDAGTDPETLRRHTLRVGKAVANRAAIMPETSAPAITVTLDSTFIRSCEDGERQLEVRVGKVETKSGARQVFGAVAKTDTDIKVMHHFRGEPGSRQSVVPSRKLWTALHALDGYLTGQSAWLVNYAERYRTGLRVGTSITEGTANFLVNRRMNKSQQMRRSRRGADRLLQVRCAVYNGTLGFDFGQKSYPANDVTPPTAVAA